MFLYGVLSISLYIESSLLAEGKLNGGLYLHRWILSKHEANQSLQYSAQIKISYIYLWSLHMLYVQG
jgi:hypothetical protein